MPTEGIDISSYQDSSPINWSQVKAAGKRFVIVKFTEGTTYVNPHGVQDAANAKAAGLDVAGYLFFHPSVDPIAQADFYLAHGGADYPGVAIDAEVTDGQSWSAIETAMQRCHDYLVQHGKTVLLYDNISWTQATGDEHWGWLIWLADPSHPTPSYPAVCHQYGTGPVPGISGDVGLDRWVGSDSDYASFFGVHPVPAPASTSPGVGTPLVLSAPLVDVVEWPGGGTLILAEDGAVYAVKGAPYLGGCNVVGFPTGRKAATLTVTGPASYRITDNTGATYDFPGPSPGVGQPWPLDGPVVDVVKWPGGGTLILTEDGAVYAAKGAPYLGGANGQPYFTGRKAAALTVTGPSSYRITDTAGETYNYGG